MTGFEPMTPLSQSECSNQAELHSVNKKEIIEFRQQDSNLRPVD